MAVRRGTGGAPQIKAYLLIVGAIMFLLWRFSSGGISLPGSEKPVANNTQPIQQPANVITPPVQPAVTPVQNPVIQQPQQPQQTNDNKRAIQVGDFMETMLTMYRPRLSSHAYSEETGFHGFLEWYDGNTLVEKLDLASLHSFGVALIKKDYGIELVYGAKRFVVTAWPKAVDHAHSSEQVQYAKNP